MRHDLELLGLGIELEHTDDLDAEHPPEQLGGIALQLGDVGAPQRALTEAGDLLLLLGLQADGVLARLRGLPRFP